MGNILRKAIEERRQRIIHRLIASKAYKLADKQLSQLSLTELEHEYRYFKQIQIIKGNRNDK